jgi:hypothetical protein
VGGILITAGCNIKEKNKEMFSPNADIVMINGKIITVNNDFDIEEAIVIKANKILAVGSNKQIKQFIGKQTRVIDLRERSVLPGFEDSHIHFLSTAAQKGTIDLHPSTTPNMETLLGRVRQKAARLPEGAWILGRGWDQDKMEWKGKWDRPYKWPTKKDLDKVAPNNPVYLIRVCGHIAVVNSKALEIAKITNYTSQPEGGQIDKYPKSGEPTGILRESAKDLVEKVIPPKELRPSYDDLQKMTELVIANGITCIEEPGLDKWGVKLYQEALEKGELPIRVNILLNSDLLDEVVKKGISSPYPIDAQKLRICGIKFFADGSLEGRTAALKEPYSDDFNTKGILEHGPEWFTEQFTKAHRYGVQCCTHAIGDLANEVVLKANKASYEAVGEKPGKYRDRIEHCQVLSSEIIDAYKEQEMIASIQFSFVTSDAKWAEERVGKERIKWSYAWQKLLDKGIRCCGGSDSPVESFIPLEGIQKIVTRQELGGTPKEGFLPDQALSIKEAIKLYTTDSAYAQWQEDCLGSIEEGKLADLIVLSGDILNTPLDKIAQLQVEFTLIDGMIVYARGKSS